MCLGWLTRRRRDILGLIPVPSLGSSLVECQGWAEDPHVQQTSVRGPWTDGSKVSFWGRVPPVPVWAWSGGGVCQPRG